MAAESILTYKKPGFPKTDNTEKSYRTIIEYVGPLADLSAAEPPANDPWGEYDGRVASTNLSPIEGTDKAELTVVCEYFYDAASGSAGTPREITYEVEWVMYSRPLLEHPAFRMGGGGPHELNAQDVAEIDGWKNAAPSLRKDNKFKDAEDDSIVILSTAAQKFIALLRMGIETYEDFSPVLRKTTSYTGGPPATSSAGEKETPPGSFPGKPSGYEFRKSADRSIRAGGQTRWERTEEWTGAKTILIDRNAIYV